MLALIQSPRHSETVAVVEGVGEHDRPLGRGVKGRPPSLRHLVVALVSDAAFEKRRDIVFQTGIAFGA